MWLSEVVKYDMIWYTQYTREYKERQFNSGKSAVRVPPSFPFKDQNLLSPT